MQSTVQHIEYTVYEGSAKEWGNAASQSKTNNDKNLVVFKNESPTS